MAQEGATQAPTPKRIVEAARILGGICDGAHERDRQGYNGVDSKFMKGLAARDTHSDKQLRLMHTTLRKYREQLAAMGVDYETLVPPPDAIRLRRVETNFGPALGLIFDYDVNLIAIAKTIRGRRFQELKDGSRVWTFPWDRETHDAILTAFAECKKAFVVEIARDELPETTVAKATSAFTVKFDRFEDPKWRQKLALIFDYDPKLVHAVKGLRKRWFDVPNKIWTIPYDCDAYHEALTALQAVTPAPTIEYADGLEAEMKTAFEAREKVYQQSRAETANLDLATKLKLRPFQMAGVQWALDHNGRCLLNDEMGLGKTAEGLGFLVAKPTALPALVICPANLKVNWLREIEKFTAFKAIIITSKSGLKSLEKLGVPCALEPQPGHDLTIVNYDLLEAESPKTWVKRLLAGDDEDAEKLLIEGSSYSLREIDKAIFKGDAAARTRLNRVTVAIKGVPEGKRSRKRFVKVSVNGTPLDTFFINAGFKTLICDESHYLKDSRSQRTMAVKAMSETAEHAICMTGTAILNRPIEIYSQVSIVNPDVFRSWKSYVYEFCAAYHDGYGLKVTGSSNLDKLDRVLRTTVMIRRLKEQVLTELPPKTVITVPLALGSKEMGQYQKAIKEIAKTLKKQKAEREAWKAKLEKMTEEEQKKFLAEHAEARAKVATLNGYVIDQIEKAKQAAVDAKFDDCVKFVLNAQEQQGKVIVFMSHHQFIDKMMTALAESGLKVAKIDGRDSLAKRTEAKDGFQDGDTQVLVCGIRAAGEGLTLTASHTVIFVEFDWNPARHQQAADRVHRIGQKVPPTIYYLIAMGTIEEDIAEMIDAKREVANVTMGEGGRTVNEDGILDAMAKRIAEEA